MGLDIFVCIKIVHALTNGLLEYAGEIRDFWPVCVLKYQLSLPELICLQDKRVTIIHGDKLLLNEAYPDSFRKTVARNIRKRDVNLILDDRVDDLSISDAGVIITRGGRRLIADLVVRSYPGCNKLMQS